jgi:hypothetical protein
MIPAGVQDFKKVDSRVLERGWLTLVEGKLLL